MHSVDVSYNQLSSTGVELLLKSLKVSTVTDLDLTGTVQNFNINHLTKHLLSYVRLVSTLYFMQVYLLKMSGLKDITVGRARYK